MEGDPTEGALYPFAAKLGMDRQAEQAALPRDAIPFRSEHKFMATLQRAASDEQMLLVKGARSHPRSLRSPADHRRPAKFTRPRALPETIGQACGSRESACWRWRGGNRT